MTSELSQKEAWGLYLALVAFLVAIFLVGVRLGALGTPAGAAESAANRSGEPDRNAIGLSSEEVPVAVYHATSDPAAERAGQSRTETATPGSAEPEAVGQMQAEAADLMETTQEPSEPLQSPSTVGESGSGFTIQVAAYSSQKEAEAMLTRLEAKGFRGRVHAPQSAGDRLFRVWVGSYLSLDEAKSHEGELKQAGFLTYSRRIE